MMREGLSLSESHIKHKIEYLAVVSLEIQAIELFLCPSAVSKDTGRE